MVKVSRLNQILTSVSTVIADLYSNVALPKRNVYDSILALEYLPLPEHPVA
jgi:hypothetical protein